MSKLKTKYDVIERYWPDFLIYCLEDRQIVKKVDSDRPPVLPTVDNFWKWYITDNVGPLAISKAGRWYTKEDVEYV